MTDKDTQRSVKDKLPVTEAVARRSSFTMVSYVLLALALLYTLYFAKSLLMPILVALLFSLLLSPMVALFKRYYVPRAISALFLLTMIGVPITFLAIELAEPSQKWLAQIPKLSAHVTKELDDLSEAMIPDAAESGAKSSSTKERKSGFFGLFRSNKDKAAEQEKAEGGSALSEGVMQGGVEIIVKVLGATPIFIAQFVTFIILVLFLLIFGPRLYANYLDIFLAGKGNQPPIELVGKLQKELSRYIFTVTIINAGLGIVTASVLWMMGVDDALLWGALVALLNFAPYVGPIIAVIILGLAGITQYGMELAALIPAAVYFGINLLEAQFITPAVLGRHMRLNPLVLILWLLVWGWLWGPAGVLLAVPLLVCLKLAAAQLNILKDWVRLIETSAS